VLTWSDAEFVRDRFTAEEDTQHRRSIIFTRLVNALERLRKSQTTKAMEDYLSSRSEYSANRLDTEHASVRFCVWLIPTLGFVGTVMGIGVGIAGFAGVIERAQNFDEIKSALPFVTSNLGTAFDTTLLALAYSAIAVFYMSFLLKRQEELLADIDALCFDKVCSVFQEHSPDSENIIRAIHENVDQILTLMNGNRGALESVIQQEMPALAHSIGNLVEPLVQHATALAQEEQGSGKQIIKEIGLLRGVQLKLHEALQAILKELQQAPRERVP
jgi:biopolymer transport protein ExbB/TolQ